MINNYEEYNKIIGDRLSSIKIDNANLYSNYNTSFISNYISIEKHNTTCFINMSYHPDRNNVITDDCGNDYLRANLHVDINYTSHGGCDTETVTKRAEFILECCKAVANIEAELKDKDVYCLYYTSEQKDIEKKLKNKKLVKEAVEISCKHMRVGSSKKICDGIFSNLLVPGDYELEISGKRYSVTVNDDKTFEVTKHK